MPLSGVQVDVLDSHSAIISSGITNEEGQAACGICLPTADTITLRVIRQGYAVLSEQVEITKQDNRQVLPLGVRLAPDDVRITMKVLVYSLATGEVLPQASVQVFARDPKGRGHHTHQSSGIVFRPNDKEQAPSTTEPADRKQGRGEIELASAETSHSGFANVGIVLSTRGEHACIIRVHREGFHRAQYAVALNAKGLRPEILIRVGMATQVRGC